MSVPVRKLNNHDSERIPLTRNVRVRADDGTLSEPEAIGNFRDIQAWVLIADPGAGKSDSFQMLSEAEGGQFISAINFMELGLPAGWHEPIFIDGLDEISAGSVAGAAVLGQIRGKLQQLGTPRFRISCREADWRGNTDSAALQYLVGQEHFLELHLAPLEKAQIRALIAHWHPCTEGQVAEFVQEAKKRDLEGLLDNPQTLRMLVKATTKGWPDSKAATYEMACAQLVRERNSAHNATKRHRAFSDDKLLQAAAFLNAVSLLSGSAVITLQRQDEHQGDVLALPELASIAGSPTMATCQTTLETNLFRGDGLGGFRPLHRTVAEYLGAQYLISRIRNGLPANRVLALMLGEDGGVVPALRGLHAWLAATGTEELRRELIDRDVLGVVIHGDVRNFTRLEKLHVLGALRGEAQRYTYFRSQNWASSPFGALATPDMVEEFRGLLCAADRSPAHQVLLDCVLDALAHGYPMPTLMPQLERLVRDKTFWPSSRKDALKVLIGYAAAAARWLPLTQLLTDIHDNRVEDLEDELLGMLLRALYPKHIPSEEIWKYFRKPKSDRLIGGAYWRFWHNMPKQGVQADAPVLLDALISTGFQLSNQYDEFHMTRLVGELLVQGVTQNGVSIGVPQLYRWLGLGLSPGHYCPLEQPHKAALAKWLGDQASTYKALLVHGLGLLADAKVDGFSKLWHVRSQLYRAPEPVDAQQWYLSLADTCAADDLRRMLVWDSFDLYRTRLSDDAALYMLEQWSDGHENDRDWIEARLRSTYPPPKVKQDSLDREAEHKQRHAEESHQKIVFFRKTLPSFADGVAHLGALGAIADAYLNIFGDSNESSPEARLLALLNHDDRWVQLALTGLRKCVFRDDLPSASQIIELAVKGQRYTLASPCLAAMEILHGERSVAAVDLPNSTIEAVVAFQLTSNINASSKWFNELLARRPDRVAVVMTNLISMQIVAQKEHPDGLFALAYDVAYQEVARQIVPKLIAALPIKASRKQLQSLRHLIIAMLGSVDTASQLELIAHRLACAGMDVAQHVYWLTIGVQVASDLYLEPARQFVDRTQLRTSHLFALLHDQVERAISIPMSATAQAFLIEVLGPRSRPLHLTSRRAVWVTAGMEMGRFVGGLISMLAASVSDEAVRAIAELQKRDDMTQWADALGRADYDQRITRRKAFFKPASVAQVCATLANLNPANAADLWALTVEHLRQLVRIIRDGNTNDYRQYWNSTSPKIEDHCRDTLLSDLKLRLDPLGISAEPESRYVDEKRADIKVMVSPLLHIPIEIKRETHRDVWKAIREQLVTKYCRDPASGGYGIYLVFWFAGKFDSAPGDGGARPKTPHELQKRLAATVPEELRHKIAVIVVDCSRPS